MTPLLQLSHYFSHCVIQILVGRVTDEVLVFIARKCAIVGAIYILHIYDTIALARARQPWPQNRLEDTGLAIFFFTLVHRNKVTFIANPVSSWRTAR